MEICQITGGTVVGIGYSGMAEAMDSSSTQCSLLYAFGSTVVAGTEIIISDADGKELTTITTVKSCDSVIYSSKELSEGETYTITAGEQSGELTMEETYTTNSTSTGMFGGRGGHMKHNITQDGTTQDGEMPERPRGERPEMPNGEVPRGERPEMSNGEVPRGERPEMPNGEVPSGENNQNSTKE